MTQCHRHIYNILSVFVSNYSAVLPRLYTLFICNAMEKLDSALQQWMSDAVVKVRGGAGDQLHETTLTTGRTVVSAVNLHYRSLPLRSANNYFYEIQQESVRPRWPYDRPSVPRCGLYNLCCLATTAGPVATITGRTDRQTDRQSATHNAAPS